MDLGDSLSKAVSAARRGDTVALEVELVRLRKVQTDNVSSIGTRLRGMARAVQSHPSYKPVAAAQAG